MGWMRLTAGRSWDCHAEALSGPCHMPGLLRVSLSGLLVSCVCTNGMILRIVRNKPGVPCQRCESGKFNRILSWFPLIPAWITYCLATSGLNRVSCQNWGRPHWSFPAISGRSWKSGLILRWRVNGRMLSWSKFGNGSLRLCVRLICMYVTL